MVAVDRAHALVDGRAREALVAAGDRGQQDLVRVADEGDLLLQQILVGGVDPGTVPDVERDG